MSGHRTARWKAMACLGLSGIILGLIMLFLTSLAMQAVAVVVGAAIVLLSLVFIVEGLYSDVAGWPRPVTVALGVLGMLTGAGMAVFPAIFLVPTGVITGLILFIYGLGQLAIGVGMVFVETMVRMVFGVLGIFSIILGLYFLITPASAVIFFVRIFGVYLLVISLMHFARALSEREAEAKMGMKQL